MIDLNFMDISDFSPCDILLCEYLAKVDVQFFWKGYHYTKYVTYSLDFMLTAGTINGGRVCRIAALHILFAAFTSGDLAVIVILFNRRK